MNTKELYSILLNIEAIIKSKGVEPKAEAHFNWIGSEVDISVGASEPYDKNGNWHREKRFEGTIDELPSLLSQAENWAYVLPNEEGRAIEHMIEKLNKLADELPKGTNEITMRAWEEICGMLKAKAATIAKNGLPSPVSISDLKESKG